MKLNFTAIIGALAMIALIFLLDTQDFFGENRNLGFLISFGVAFFIVLEALTRRHKK